MHRVCLLCAALMASTAYGPALWRKLPACLFHRTCCRPPELNWIQLPIMILTDFAAQSIELHAR
jgi:hypothetical protein